MIPPRRLMLQLTPLLDLLLIVMFAQYLEMQQVVKRQAAEMATSRDELKQQLDESIRQLVALRERMVALENEAAHAEARAGEADRLRVQRDLIGELVADLFRVPEATVKQLLQQRRTNGPGPSVDDVSQAQARWRQAFGSSNDAVVDHLLTFGEMRKRIDVWELYLQENGTCVLTVGNRRQSFRAETTESFAGRFFEAYKVLPEPKSMVLVMVSYGDAQFRLRKAAVDGVALALERVRKDSGGRTRFEFATLGFRPTNGAAISAP